ncbi:MAG: 4-(cytidine 5'-diphospho)-2-C-methyl-D-erythritol kinase [Candidatus Didemnitutus sp.]|nr:4-(cytidine 5'-diphospho)-2-C-methyl-D-erythritol kinase [Candidatus Didemnitutus sp.]
MPVTLFCPAKLNLYLAVTGRRADGFHDLVSVVTPLAFGDELEAELRPGSGEEPRFTLACDAPGVPLDGTNLVLKAAQAFAAATGWDGAAHFRLQKRIPTGAGLGGGSSNAVAALRALDRLAGTALSAQRLEALAAGLGSDCVLFLRSGPVIMSGRGEQVEDLPEGAAGRLRGRRVIVFKPSFGIATPWAYGRMVARGTDYIARDEAEATLARWLADTQAPVAALLANNMQPAAFEKYVALPLLLARLRREFGVATLMSGSGSACFALADDPAQEAAVAVCIRECWGEQAVVAATALA